VTSHDLRANSSARPAVAEHVADPAHDARERHRTEPHVRIGLAGLVPDAVAERYRFDQQAIEKAHFRASHAGCGPDERALAKSLRRRLLLLPLFRNCRTK
jgi:hypothetical protein